MHSSAAGRVGAFVHVPVPGESFEAYLPPPLPPDPPVDLQQVVQLLDRAGRSVGRLDGIAAILPDTSLFLYMYVRKEALVSSQIEGTQSSLNDLLMYEIEESPGVPLDDVREVSQYVAALNHGLDRLRGGFPLSLRLICEIHKELLVSGRGQQRLPGEFRTSQNWIGGTRPGNAVFVPPPPDRLMDCLDNFEKFLHLDSVPPLIKAALAHVQFESIHPFLDGNGRVGRLLITLLLCADGVLREPLLYLSLYLKTNRQTYYDLLQRVRLTGDWESWVRFFLEGVAETADQAVTSTREILALVEQDRRRIESAGRAAPFMLRLHHYLSRKPIMTISRAAADLSSTRPTVANAVEHMRRLGILKEISNRKKGRVFAYQRYQEILSRGTEPIPS